jgi:hypothetical protein
LLAFVIASAAAQSGTFTPTSETVIPNAVVVTYNPADGNVSYDSIGWGIREMELRSNASLFDPVNVNQDVIVSPFDVFTPARFFKLAPGGIESVDIRPVLPVGLSTQVLLDDLQIDGGVILGSLAELPGGGPDLYVVPIPQPSGLVLTGYRVLYLRRPRSRRG